MEKVKFRGGAMLAPTPPVMVSCGDMDRSNILTAAWTGIINTRPPITYVSVRKQRLSHEIISEKGEFVINLTSADLVRAMDYCGVRSGRDVDKFKAANLTAKKGSKIAAPIVNECPLALECKVVHSLKLGSHIMYVGEIVAVQAEKSLIDEKGKFNLTEADILGYAHGGYYGLTENIGTFGFSVKKK